MTLIQRAFCVAFFTLCIHPVAMGASTSLTVSDPSARTGDTVTITVDAGDENGGALIALLSSEQSDGESPLEPSMWHYGQADQDGILSYQLNLTAAMEYKVYYLQAIGLHTDTIRSDLGTLRIYPNGGSWLPYDIDEAYAWGWAGENSENLTMTPGPRGATLITFMADLTGNGNDWSNVGQGKEAAWYPAGLQVDGWTSPYPAIAVDNYPNGQEHYGNVYYQQNGFDASGTFYLAAVCGNQRDRGDRELFGTDSQNYIRFDQLRNRAYLSVNGTTLRVVEEGNLPRGVFLFELWRDANNVIHVAANGVEIGNGATLSGRFDLVGFGSDGGGASQWDDWAFEIFQAKPLPSPQDLQSFRDYVLAKWNL